MQSETLDALEQLLREQPMTARAIAAAMGCCRPVAYDRLRALKKRGVKLRQRRVREGASGPKATAYSVTSA